jgi:hypothetical protein
MSSKGQIITFAALILGRGSQINVSDSWASSEILTSV